LPGGQRLVHRQLRVHRQIEEAPGLDKNLLDQRGRNAVIDDIGKTFVQAGAAKRGADGRARRRIARAHAGEADDRECRGLGLIQFLSPCSMPQAIAGVAGVESKMIPLACIQAALPLCAAAAPA
jgi:hypothetical protein